MDLYRRMARVRTQEEGDDITDELIDRYGDPPQSVTNLIAIALLRARAAALADLTAQGAAWGAEALLGLRVAYQPFVNDGTVFIAVTAYATPVRGGQRG